MKTFLPLLMLAALPCAVMAADFDPGMRFSDFVHAKAPPAQTSASVPAGSLSRRRVAELIGQASDWRARKDDALNALDTLITNKESPATAAEWHRVGINVKDSAQSIEDHLDILYSRASARVRAEETDPKSVARRLAALEVERDFRKFAVYANIVPRVIDESVCGDGGRDCVGRRFAGPRWKIWLTWNEVTAVNRAVVSAKANKG
jgi:hypothetical protein